MSNYNRPIIPYGNSFYINIELKQFNKDSGEYEYFDITTCHDVKVNLICAQHNTVIPLQFELLEGYNYILKCFVDYRLLHTTSYGVMVEGLNADDMHWRWTMLPKEGILVVNNTSGMNIPDDVTTVDLAGRVGWGIQTDADLTNYYTKTEVNTLIENVEVDLDDYYTKSEVDDLIDDTESIIADNYYDKTEVDNTLDNYYDKTDIDEKLDDYYDKTEVDNLLDDKQETLESGVNIKTVNGQSLLGEGNITISGGGGGTQVQSDWEETDTTSPAYIQNKPDITSIEGSISDVQNDIDNIEDDIAAQQAEISGVQTAISGHQTALESQATEISGIQTQISGHQTALENNASEINGIQSAISGHQTAIENLYTEKQDVLESGVNIKTINNESILGEGNITIESGVEVEPAKIVVTDEEVADPDPDAVYIVQKPIELKTINGNEIIGTGNIEISGGEQSDWNETDTTSPAYIQNKPDITSIEDNIADVQNDIDNLEDDIAAQQAEISGVQTAISGHQTAIQNQATEISGMQTQISGHQTALETQATEISGIQSNISGMQTEISGIQTTIAGHQTAIQNQATEISGMQTVLAGHQTALENQSGGGDPGFIKVGNGVVNYNSTGYSTTLGSRAMIQGEGTSPSFEIKATGYNSHAEGERTQATGGNSHAEGYYTKATGLASHAEGTGSQANTQCSHAEGYYTQANNYIEHVAGQYNSSPTVSQWSFNGSATAIVSSIGNGSGNNSRHNAFEVRQNGDIYYADTEKIDGSTVHFYDAPMRKLQDAMVTSTTTSGLKIEVVSALPATPDANTIYIVQ